LEAKIRELAKLADLEEKGAGINKMMAMKKRKRRVVSDEEEEESDEEAQMEKKGGKGGQERKGQIEEAEKQPNRNGGNMKERKPRGYLVNMGKMQ
jgi:hypothetical protein